VGSNPTLDMDVSVCLFRVCVVLCVDSGLVKGCSPVQGVLPTVYSSKEIKKAAKAQQKKTVQPIIIIMIIKLIISYFFNFNNWPLSQLITLLLGCPLNTTHTVERKLLFYNELGLFVNRLSFHEMCDLLALTFSSPGLWGVGGWVVAVDSTFVGPGGGGYRTFSRLRRSPGSARWSFWYRYD
jgi:hypothetical protein